MGPLSEPLQMRIVDLCVDDRFRRMRVATKLVAETIGWLRGAKIDLIDIVVPETNLVAQQFCRACAFRAVDLMRGCFRDGALDAIHFEYEMRYPRTCVGALASTKGAR